MNAAVRVFFLAAVLGVFGCAAASDLNPAFPLRESEARSILKELAGSPAVIKRPVVVFAGYQDPGFQAAAVARKIRRVSDDPGRIITVTFFGPNTFDGCRERAVREIDAAFPTDDPAFTTEVDVIGISMGGLVARHAARAQGDGVRRLRIHTLFTIGTPHQGAKLAKLPTFDKRQIDMRPGSEFLEELNADPTTQDFEIVAYAYLDDGIVGVARTALPGQFPWWLPGEPFPFSHMAAVSDSRILADIVQRLRGKPPFTIGTPSLPDGTGDGDDS